jgi:iron complex transport system ATP-binding protein
MNLRAENLHFAYRPTTPVLQGIDLKFPSGTVTGLFGPNGSGKSTLLRCLTGALRPQLGATWCGNLRVDKLLPREVARYIAVVPQDTPCGVPLTAREMVALGRFASGDENPSRVSAALARVGAENLADRAFDELSGGERQRVIIARALAQDAPILLFDEPATHLDVAHQVEVHRLARVLASEGRTVVMACHDLVLAPLFLDRAALLENGRLAVVGNPVDVLTRERIAKVFGVDLEVSSGPGLSVTLRLPSGLISPVGPEQGLGAP